MLVATIQSLECESTPANSAHLQLTCQVVGTDEAIFASRGGQLTWCRWRRRPVMQVERSPP